MLEMKSAPAFCARLIEGKYVAGRTLEELELEASRRALALLKNKLGSKAIAELLHEEVEEADRVWEEWAAASKGEWWVNPMEYEIEGLDLQVWLDWLRANLADEEMQFAVHPEHYAWTAAARIDEGPHPGDWVVLEPMGGYLLRGYARLEPWPGAEAYFDPDYPVRVQISGYTRKGVNIHRSLAQYRETPTGFRCKFYSMKPAATPKESQAGSQEHGYLEYVKYMARAREAWDRGQV